MLIKITAIFCVLGFVCLKDATTQPTTVRPYKFGFTIDEQQHRSEQRDERGIVMGEFGFITADGIYHVTVYATDENGKFRILAMRNYPYTPVAPTAITTSTSTTEQPKEAPPRYNFNNNACSGCSLLNGNGGSQKSAAAPGSTKTEIRPLSKPLQVDVTQTTRPGSVEGVDQQSQGTPTHISNTLSSTHTQTKPTNTHTDSQLINEVRFGAAVSAMRKFEAQSDTKSPLIVTGKVATSSKFANALNNRNVNYLVGEQAKSPIGATNKFSTSLASQLVSTPLKVSLDRQILQSPSGGLFTSANLPLRPSNSQVGGSVAAKPTTNAGNSVSAFGPTPVGKLPLNNSGNLALRPSGSQVGPSSTLNGISTSTAGRLPLNTFATVATGKLPLNAAGNVRGNDNSGQPNVGVQSALSPPSKSSPISSAPSPLIVPPKSAKYSAGNTKTATLGNSGFVNSKAPLQSDSSPGGLGAQGVTQTHLYALIDQPQSTPGRIASGSPVVPKVTSTKNQNQLAASVSDTLGNIVLPIKSTVAADRKTHQPTHDQHTPQHTNIYNKFATQPSQQPNAKLPQTQTGSAPQTPINTALNTPKAVVPLTQTQTNTQQPGLNAIDNPNAQTPQTGNKNTPNTATQTVAGNNAPQTTKATAPGIDIRFDKTATPLGAGKPTTQGGTPPRQAGGSGNSGSIDDTGDLYRFKYILDYNGHTETGGRNGNKVGNYFVIGDDEVERTIEYIANEFGFQPQVHWRKVDVKTLPKDNTLKDYEFTWFKKE